MKLSDLLPRTIVNHRPRIVTIGSWPHDFTFDLPLALRPKPPHIIMRDLSIPKRSMLVVDGIGFIGPDNADHLGPPDGFTTDGTTTWRHWKVEP